MSQGPGSAVRKLNTSSKDVGGSYNSNNKPPSHQDLARRPPSEINKLAAEEPSSNPPSFGAVNPHPNSSTKK
ncbi:hypothetical protein L2E82_28121 [Cichorium intybus]|uniref:Uncharacterized protein n=1 Tax=Cichorium intybus TaxID=13427 RepID=A0ACB9CVJ3_CICIN|nr:hypothetical protein L2E82_28121 [Cichorium intybus]